MTAIPCWGRTAERASSSRKMTALTCAPASFRVKKQWPDGGNEGVEISPPLGSALLLETWRWMDARYRIDTQVIGIDRA